MTSVGVEVTEAFAVVVVVALPCLESQTGGSEEIVSHLKNTMHRLKISGNNNVLYIYLIHCRIPVGLLWNRICTIFFFNNGEISWYTYTHKNLTQEANVGCLIMALGWANIELTAKTKSLNNTNIEMTLNL